VLYGCEKRWLTIEKDILKYVEEENSKVDAWSSN
jgi:hypothetical protein